ncbi:hypothetical protein [Cellulomonas sp. ATA003]|uniref:hypothetical protein n=1 Tax=Cellulomonas sp. ATA003 TaxID=3073064 RepID=UPI002872B551|nr:hypothetical protein [Cellulomonas sp. ATA003]WNB87479.1 hypothetical protein REH70_08220 [Cellulomonas sp. ATA003]
MRANRLVGNPRGAAVIEVVLGGLVLRAHGPQVLAVTGAPAPLTVLAADGGERAHPRPGRPFALPDGERLRLGAPASGLRSYVAVRGGIGVAPVLGSRSTDVLSGLGPSPLRTGDVLGVLGPPRTPSPRGRTSPTSATRATRAARRPGGPPTAPRRPSRCACGGVRARTG